MVILLVGIVRNLSTLRIEAKKWHPMRGKKMKDVKDEKNEREGINYEEREV